MLIINKVDDKTIDIATGALKETAKGFRSPASYIAIASEDMVTVRSISPSIAFNQTEHYSRVQVDGTVHASANDAVVALNRFIGNFKSGGGSPGSEIPVEVSGMSVRFIDYDGTLLKVQPIKIGDNAKFPADPDRTNEGLTFTGWTHTQDELNNLKGPLDVGALYRTTDGATHIFITLTPTTGLSPTFYFSKAGSPTLTFDWGDGTTTETTSTTVQHTFPAHGNYIVRVRQAAGTTGGRYSLGGGTSSTSLVGSSTGGYTDILTRVFVGVDNATNPVSVRPYAFYNCYSLRAVAGDHSDPLGDYAYANCYSLRALILSTTTRSTGASSGVSLRALRAIVLHNGIIQLAASLSSNCYSLDTIIIPEKAEILTGALPGVNNVQRIVVNSVTPASLGSGNFTTNNKITKIYVPDESVGAYKAATNWVALASYIHPMSSM